MDCPPGYRLYADVISRLGPVRSDSAGLSCRCPFHERHKNGDSKPSCRLWIGATGELVGRCMGCGADWLELVEYVGLPKSEWFPSKKLPDRRWQVRSKMVEQYPYTDKNGVLLAIKARWEPGFDGRSKDFTWSRPISDIDDRKNLASQGVDEAEDCWIRGGKCLERGDYRGERVRVYGTQDRFEWVFRGTTDPKCPATGPTISMGAAFISLYGLAEIHQSDPKAGIVVVEGERKANRLRELGFVAVSGPAGKSKWASSWGASFRDRRVCVIPDREPGTGDVTALEWGDKVMASAIASGAESVRMVKLPPSELKPNLQGGDILDWIKFHFPETDWHRISPAEKKSIRASVAKLLHDTTEYKRTVC